LLVAGWLWKDSSPTFHPSVYFVQAEPLDIFTTYSTDLPLCIVLFRSAD